MNITDTLTQMAADGLRMVTCPVCRKAWIWGPGDPKVQPTKRGLCTCRECRESVEKPSGNHGKQRKAIGDENPGFENGVRALEDQP